MNRNRVEPIILNDHMRYYDEMLRESNKQIPAYRGILYEQFTDSFGNSIFKKIGENTVVVGGAIESLEHLVGVNASWKPKTLNELYGINNVAGNDANSKIALFGVGTGGSGLQMGSLVEKDVKSRNVPDLIPLRVTETLTGDDSDLYFFKKANADGTNSYYLKEFGVTPVIKTCWKDALDDDDDGTEVVDEIADSTRTENLVTFAEFVIDLNMKDVREYFESIGALDSAWYSSIGLFTGEKVEQVDGSYEYANIRLFSYLNIDHKSVRIKTASRYLYRVQALV